RPVNLIVPLELDC
ncbi:hypothetical protein V3C99_010610, partial [Haemonchus contortus]